MCDVHVVVCVVCVCCACGGVCGVCVFCMWWYVCGVCVCVLALHLPSSLVLFFFWKEILPSQRPNSVSTIAVKRAEDVRNFKMLFMWVFFLRNVGMLSLYVC